MQLSTGSCASLPAVLCQSLSAQTVTQNALKSCVHACAQAPACSQPHSRRVMAELRPNMFELVCGARRELGTFVKKKLGSEKTSPLTTTSTICDNGKKDRARFTENTLTVSSVFGH